MPTALFVCNRSSGRHLSGDQEGSEAATPDDVVGWLRDGGLTVEVLAGSLDAQLAASRERPADLIVVDGGDGTIRAVIEAQRDRDLPIGVIPGGTMNLLAGDYGVPEDREAAVQAVLAGNVRQADLGIAGSRIFLHTALFGLPVRIGTHRERGRGRLSLWDKARLGLHSLATWRRDPRLSLHGEGTSKAVSLEGSSMALVVGTLDEVAFPRPKRESVTGGTLTVFALRPGSGAELARLAVRGAFGTLSTDESVETALVSSASLSSPRKRLRALLDGEGKLLPAPVDIKVLPQAVTVFAPPTATATDTAHPESSRRDPMNAMPNPPTTPPSGAPTTA